MRNSEEDALHLAAEIRWQDPEEAVRVLQGYLRENPTAVRIKLALAHLHSMDAVVEDAAAAERLYREVLAADPDNVGALSGLAFMHGFPGGTVSIEESLQLLTRAAAVSGNLDDIWNLAYKAWENSRYEVAELGFARLLAVANAAGRAGIARLAQDVLVLVRARERPRLISWTEFEVAKSAEDST